MQRQTKVLLTILVILLAIGMVASLVGPVVGRHSVDGFTIVPDMLNTVAEFGEPFTTDQQGTR